MASCCCWVLYIVDGGVDDVSRIWWIPNRNAAALSPEV
jgi:hypothetical protein